MMIKLKPIVGIALVAVLLSACSAASSRYGGSQAGGPGVGTAREAAHVGSGAMKPRAAGGGQE